MRFERCFFALAMMCLLGSLTSCGLMSRTVADDSVVDTLPGADLEFEFWDELATRSVVTNNDAFYGLLLVAADSEDGPGATYEERLAEAYQLGWISRSTDLPPNESANVGTISRIICQLLDIRGGVTTRVFGLSERYCTRELVYLEILPPRTDNQSLTGLEFIDLTGTVEDRLARATVGKEVSELIRKDES